MSSEVSPGDPDRPDQLYHYTTAEGLLGIVDSFEMRATDIRFLNDSTELQYARDILLGQYNALPMGEPDYYEDFGSGPEPVFDGRPGIVAMAMLDELSSTFRCYVVCFSQNDDVLSQWRGYTSEQGYSLAFDTARLQAACDEFVSDIDEAQSGQLVPVMYDRAEISRVLGVHAADLHALRSGHPGVQGYYTAMHLVPVLASIKHDAFQEENEWRITLMRSDALGRTLGADMQAAAIPEKVVQFRASRYGVVPYSIFRLPEHCLRQVRVGPGPHAETRAEGVREMLAQRQLYEVEVVTSEVPFRG